MALVTMLRISHFEMSDSMQLRACIAVKFSVQMETALMVQ
jgi:hypothetical protein